MVDVTDAEIDAALSKGQRLRETEPRAVAARYDVRQGRVVIDLADGCAFAFPPRLAQGLEGATNADLKNVEVTSGGRGLHWESLDVDLLVPALVQGIFGTRKWMAARGGRSTSPAKVAAARRNGALGGRPKRSVVA